MDRGHLLELIEPMLKDFKDEVAKLRSAGATQADIDRMLDKFERAYAPEEDDEGKLVVAILRQAASQRTCCPALATSANRRSFWSKTAGGTLLAA